MMDLIGIQQVDLNPYIGGDLLVFNGTISHPQGATDVEMVVGKGDRIRNVVLNFVTILCRSAFRGIIRR